MEKLEKPKNKHNHCLTDYLKVCLFAMIMIAPIIAVITECLFVICNKNAPAEYVDVTNVFYTAVDKLNNQPLFNWTANTGIYTAINNMTTGLEFGASGNTLALLLTYWSLNTAVYIIFDIVITIFTKLTHLLS